MWIRTWVLVPVNVATLTHFQTFLLVGSDVLWKQVDVTLRMLVGTQSF